MARLPLATFFGAYLFSCYVGTLALLFSGRFRALYLIFSGSEPIDLSRADLLTVLVLLHAGPAALWVGYELAWRAWRREPDWGEADARATRIAATLIFAASAAWAAWSLVRVGGAEQALSSWLDYNAYVRERWRWFGALGFGEFVNLYTLLPLAAVGFMLAVRRWSVGLGALLLALALQYPLSIRKVLLTTLMLAAFSLYVYWTFGAPARRALSRRRRWAAIIGIPAGLYTVYASLTLMTTLGPRSRAFQTLASDSTVVNAAKQRRAANRLRFSSAGEAPAVEFDVTDEALRDIVNDRTSAVLLYTLLAPLTRTSICAIAYPAVFPRWHPYYAPDLGLDILGWGRMPDDNLVVYRHLWPAHDAGSVAAPFHVVLYSQGGLPAALIGSLLTGALLALGWRLVPRDAQPSIAASQWGALVLTFAVFIAIDSLRNSVIVSYGLAWGMPVVFALHAAGRARRSPYAVRAVS